MADTTVRITKQTHKKLETISETTKMSMRDIVCELVDKVDIDKVKLTRRI